MKIASLAENKNYEKRVAITPEIAKKYISIGFDVSISEDYASHLGFSDDNYKSQGVSIFKDKKNLIENSDLIVQLEIPSDDNLNYLR